MERNSDICERTANDLPLFVGGELDSAPRAELARHLETCARCRAAEKAARSAQRALARGLGEHAGPGPDLWSAIRAQLVLEGRIQTPDAHPAAAPTTETVRAGSVGSDTTRVASRWTSLASVGWAAALAAGVLLTVWITRVSPSGRGDVPLSPGSESTEYMADGAVPGMREPVVTLPVSDTGLRRLAPDERALTDTAVMLGTEERVPYSILPIQSNRGNEAASLRRVNPWR